MTRTRRPATADLMLTRLGLLAEDPAVVAACAATAVSVLAQDSAESAAALGHAAIGLLDREAVATPLALLLGAAEAAVTTGQGDAADQLSSA